MNVLLIGKGAREHALAWKIQQSPMLGKLYLYPGNARSLRHGAPFGSGIDGGFSSLVQKAQERSIDLVICGPEDPLAEGLADAFLDAGIKVFGPARAVARLEASKAYAKTIMQAAGIPTADFAIVEGEEACFAEAMRRLNETGGAVIKASGLAAGKGVFVCKTKEDIQEACGRLYGSSMRDAAATVVIEDLLVGRECSYFTLLGCGGSSPLGFAVDFKRLEPEDKGPNTGGMGCYTPVPWLPADAKEQVETLVVKPLLDQLAKEGLSYVGCLFVGLMWGDEGPKVVEFNVRFGDPEATVLAMADSRDWLSMMSFKAFGAGEPWAEGAAMKPTVATVLASSGYPYGEGESEAVAIPEALFAPTEETMVFAASVTGDNRTVMTGRGRVLTVCGQGESLAGARETCVARVRALAAVWPKARWRSDIALKAVEEEAKGPRS